MTLFFGLSLFLSSAMADLPSDVPEPTEPSDDSSAKENDPESGCNTLSQVDFGLIVLPIVVLGGALIFHKEE